MQPSRIPKPKPATGQAQATSSQRSSGSRIPLPLQVDVAQAEQCGSTRSDKLISDYLSRHSATKPLQGHAVRHPLAALENLQAALSDLHVAYDLDKPAKKFDSKPVVAHHSGQAAGGRVYRYAASSRSQEDVLKADEFQSEHHLTQQHSPRLEPHPSQCSPVAETACTSGASGVQITSDETGCCLVQCNPATFPSPMPLHATCYSLPDEIEQESSTLNSTTTAQDSISASTPCRADSVTAALTPAALLYTAEHSPSVYCTPHGSSPMFAHHTMVESPSPDGDEGWYSPGMILETCILDAHDPARHPPGCDLSPGRCFSRPDSPSLLYGQGSAFSVDVLGQENDVSSQWLTS